MDRDGRDQPEDRPGSETDWSIEDFDDFSAFDGLDLGADDAEQAQLDFGGGHAHGEADDRPHAEPDDGSEAAAVDDTADDTGTVSDDAGGVSAVDDTADDAGSVSDGADAAADQPAHAAVDDVTPDEAEDTTADDGAPAEGGMAPDVRGRGSGPNEAEAAEPITPLGFEAVSEPESSMRRPAETQPSPVPEVEHEVFDLDDIPDFSQFTHEQYVQATTQEYAGLAEDVARAATEQAEPMAVAAGIPGLEHGVVGLEDVVTDTDEGASFAPVRSGSDLSVRVLTGLALIAIFFGSLTQDYLVAILIFVVMFIAAVEMYVVLVRVGHRPMTLLGLFGIAGALFGAWYWGPIAVPVAIILTGVATLVFFGVVAQRREPLLDTALTMLVLAWIGGLGALAMDIAWAPDFAWMIAAVVVITALMDVAQYFVGRRFGKRALAPRISPKKTLEGLLGGVVVAVGVGLIFGNFGPFELTDGLLLGVLVAVVAPLGDLAVSVVKRAIGVKDMGAILPGHGGVLDRIDAMVFVIPAAWVAYSWMGLVA